MAERHGLALLAVCALHRERENKKKEREISRVTPQTHIGRREIVMENIAMPSLLCLRNTRLFIILFVRDSGKVCLQFWSSVLNSVRGPFNKISRGNPLLC